ncbi:MAG: phosphate ABC transporter substrate-binding protein [Proteobacteria bacterium]|nr:phosphate ABC transporter substrate-binding protein [Pseudomonadota bacterium]
MLRIFPLVFALFFIFSVDVLAFEFQVTKRNHISMVGSSTVYPFAATIAEEFGRNSKIKDSQFKTPIVESTGTGGGFKLFCSGVGYNYPDFSNASRLIEKSEIKRCGENGVKEIVEIKIGYDGIVLANSIAGQKYNLTKKQIFLALSEKVPDPKSGKLVENFYQKWSDIDKSLPEVTIAIYGPPSTSGTRDAFVELVMDSVCLEMKEFVESYPDKKIRQKKCHIIRSDGKFIEAGENDNLIVQKLRNDKQALGIFGFSFLEENHELIQAATIDKVMPSFENIASGTYKVSRPLFIYFKKEHLDLILGMREFVKEIISSDTIGVDGYLLQKGLIPLTDLETKKVRDKVMRSL